MIGFQSAFEGAGGILTSFLDGLFGCWWLETDALDLPDHPSYHSFLLAFLFQI